MMASLDGGLVGLGPLSYLSPFPFGTLADTNQVMMSADCFVEWSKHTALTPATGATLLTCLYPLMGRT